MSAKGTVEPQYNACLEIQKKQGLTQLGIMTNQVWYDDPRRLAFVLARYKFVAKMLSGSETVAEIGCGDAFGSRIVLQDVNTLHVYDIDPVFVDDINQRREQKWALTARVHNILSSPLAEKYDAIYSLDVIEHISEQDEESYIQNIKNSLQPHGIVIVGSPSLESQTYASPQSKIGHINCKSGNAYKQFFKKHFHQAFVFSMNDEVVHTGYYPMAHYLFAVCCGAKE